MAIAMLSALLSGAANAGGPARTGEAMVYAVSDAQLSDLRALRSGKGIAVTAAVQRNLDRLAHDPAIFEESPEFVSSCPFVPDIAIDLQNPARPGQWWLVATPCGKAALVDEAMPADAWPARAKYLKADVLKNLERCKLNGWTAGQECLALWGRK